MSGKEIRPRMTESEYREFKQWQGIRNACNELNVDIKDVKHGWLKNKDASLFFKNNFENEEAQAEFEKRILDIVKSNVPKIQKPIFKDLGEHLLIIDPADVHIGALSDANETGQSYNNDIAVQRMYEGVNAICKGANHYGIDTCLLVIGNDILHTDTPFRTTTAGTKQDTVGMWYDNFCVGLETYIAVIKHLYITYKNVQVVYNPSNHDYTNGFFLAKAVQQYFHNTTVQFNIDMAHRKYTIYGNNLIGTTHGDGAKNDDLALLMAHESSEHWANCNHRYFYTHHIHHKQSKDIFSVCIESVRSPKTADSWHHRNGYQHAPCAIEGFIHHKTKGQVSRLTHLF